jgi:quercetin dioxygenase-like cupin family protein
MNVRSGAAFESRWSRQRAVVRLSGAESQGKLLRVEFTAAPGSRVVPHRHLLQRERFEVIEGRLRWRVGRRTIEGGPGASVEIPPGVKHGFRNAGPEDARFLVEFRPALRTEELFVALCELERNALRLRHLRRNLSRLRALAADHGESFFFLSALPIWLQRVFLAGIGGTTGLIPGPPERPLRRVQPKGHKEG